MEWTKLMDAPARELRIGGRIVFGSGQELKLTGERVSALTVEEGADGALAPGSVLSARCTLDLVNDAGQWRAGGELLGGRVLTGATLMPELGAVDGGTVLWRPLGVYQVESARYMEGEAVLRLEAVDSIGCELAARFEDGLAYPATLEELWRHALAQTRYVWSGGVPNGSAVIDAPPDWREATLRGALGSIAAAAGCFVCVDRDGSLALRPLWDAGAAVRRIDAQTYLKLERDGEGYGPVDSLRLVPAGAEEEQIYRSAADGSALFALSVSGNPLFQVGAAGLDGLAQGMLAAVAGYESASMRFTWRGDPELGVGGRVCLRDAAGEAHAGVITRQTLSFSKGFSANCSCAVPEADSSGVRRLLTPEGGLNAAALTGAVDGALLSVGSVTANKIAAGSVTAEKLETGSVDAHILNAVTAKIGSLTADEIETDALAAELARLTVLIAGTAEFDRATVTHLVAEAMHLNFGEAGQVFIQNLAVEYAQMVGATVGNLCIKASDGNYYALDVGADGGVTATKATVTDGEIAAGQTDGGRVILETSITAANLNTSNLLATFALVNRIDAARIDVDQLFAREAFVSLLRTSRIVGDKSIELIAQDASAAQEAVENLEVGGRNLLKNSSLASDADGWETFGPSAEMGIATHDGRMCFHFQGAIGSNKSLRQRVIDQIRGDDLSQTYVLSAEVSLLNYAPGETNPLVALYMGGSYDNNGATVWLGATRVSGTLPNANNNLPDFNNRGWQRVHYVVRFEHVPTQMRVFIYARDFTGDLYVRNVKFERGNKMTDWTPAPEDAEATIEEAVGTFTDAVTRIDGDMVNLQNQIDGAITTWFYPVPPTADNPPAADWATTEAKNNHLGDLYYDTDTGYCYRWQVQGGAYSWLRITDTDVTKALADAAAAQDTADAKRRVFVSTPVPPYDVGDLWTQGDSGEILRCKTQKRSGQSYAAADWVKACKYTDDTAVDSLQVGGRNLIRDSSMEHGYGWDSYALVSSTDGMDGGSCFKVAGVLNMTQSVNQTDTAWNHLAAEGYFKPGEQYVVSYWARAENLVYGTTRPAVGFVMGIYLDETWVAQVALLNAIPEGTSDWTRYWAVVTIPTKAFNRVQSAAIFFRDYTGTVYIDKIQMERGNKLTDWTPAQEDVDQRVDDVGAAADAAQATANNAVTRSEFQRVVRIDDEGLHVGDNQSNGEVLVDSASVNVVFNGRRYSRFSGNYVQFGNYQLRQSSDGGLVFKLA